MKLLDNLFRICGALFIVVVSTFQLLSQFEDNNPFYIQVYNSQKGLIQNQVLAFAESEKGMYISTMNDVMLFDGSTFQSVNYSSRTLAQNQLFYHKKSKVLYGFSNRNFNYSIYPQFKPTYNAYKIYTAIDYHEDFYTTIDENGLIEIYNYQHQIISIYHTSIKNCEAILNDSKYIYLSDKNYLYSFNKKTASLTILKVGYYRKIKRTLFNQQIFALGDNVCLINNNNKAEPFHLPDNEVALYRDIEYINNNEYFITSSSGLFYYNNSTINSKSYKKISANSFYNLHYNSSEDCIFVGTESSGFLVLSKKKSTTYFFEKESNGSQSFTSIVKDSKENIYSVLNKGKIVTLKNGKLTLFKDLKKDIQSLNFIDNKLYAGSWGKSVIVLSKDVVVDTIRLITEEINSAYFTTMDANKTLWLGTLKGLFRRKHGSLNNIKTEMTQKAVSFYKLSDGNYVVGGQNEICFFNINGSIIKRITEKDGLNCKEVRCFYEDKNKTLWIGTYGGGLYYYNNNHLISVNEYNNCMLDKDVFSLVKHDNGLIYMSSNNGIWAVYEQSLNNFCNHTINYLIPFYFGEKIGLINNEFNGGFQNNHLLTKNSIFFPSIFGFVEFNTQKKPTKRNITPYFRDIIVNDTLKTTSNVFKRNTHTISINFSIKNFLDQSNVYFQYQLTNNEREDPWSKLQKEKNITLKMLPPGSYTVKIRVLDAFNLTESPTIVYSFSISPYFYETFWFKLLLLTLFIAFITLIFSMFYRNLKKKELIKNQISELKLNAVHSKLNPHFIFNTLNSVMYLMDIDKQDEAQKLIEGFSKLLRQFLNASDDSFVPLEEELRIIDLYLTIQQKRYNFDYEITYTYNVADVLIPSFIIQPFVENSLVHGIVHSDNRGMIYIIVHSFENKIIIKIEDNGIGRKKASEINKNRTNHISIGTKLVDKKLRILEKKFNKKINLNYIDINTNNQTGTLVIIEILLHD